MSQTAPEQPSEVPGGIGAHIRAWFERDIAPRLDAVDTDAQKALRAVTALLQHAGTQSAALQSVLGVVKDANPEMAAKLTPVIDGLVKDGEVIAKVAGELGLKL